MSNEPRLAQLLLRDRVLLIGGLIVVTIATWVYTIDMALMMSSGADEVATDALSPGPALGPASQPSLGAASQPSQQPVVAGHGPTVAQILKPHAEDHMSAGALILMWVIMMIAMMLPSAGPVGMMHAKFVRSKNGGEPAYLTGMFFFGYCLVWAGFSVVAALAQVLLERSELMSPVAMVLFSSVAGGITLVVAGLFQFSPWKAACLHECRTPLGFLMTEWRDGAYGSFVMGIKNGLFCLGCCWAIMVLLFVGGVMSMLWMGGLTALMLIEKVAPGGARISRAAGLVMIGGGVLMLLN